MRIIAHQCTNMSEKDVILTIKKFDDGTVSISGNFPTLKKEKDGYFFVQCPIFRTLGSSKVSFEEAIKDHEIDVKLFFKVHIERGTLKRALRSLKWRKVSETDYDLAKIPSFLLNQNESISISHTYA